MAKGRVYHNRQPYSRTLASECHSSFDGFETYEVFKPKKKVRETSTHIERDPNTGEFFIKKEAR